MTDVDHDLTTLGDRPLGHLCEVARNRSGLTLREAATAAGVSHVTVLAWERRSDLRMVEFWRNRGFAFPEGGVEDHVAQLGKLRTFSVGGRIVDRGVTAEWSGMTFRRVDPSAVAINTSVSGRPVDDSARPRELDEHEYAVDEATGTYRFSQLLHGRRSVIVSFVRHAP